MNECCMYDTAKKATSLLERTTSMEAQDALPLKENQRPSRVFFGGSRVERINIGSTSNE